MAEATEMVEKAGMNFLSFVEANSSVVRRSCRGLYASMNLSII